MFATHTMPRVSILQMHFLAFFLSISLVFREVTIIQVRCGHL